MGTRLLSEQQLAYVPFALTACVSVNKVASACFFLPINNMAVFTKISPAPFCWVSTGSSVMRSPAYSRWSLG